jgi:hypothetical protein
MKDQAHSPARAKETQLLQFNSGENDKKGYQSGGFNSVHESPGHAGYRKRENFGEIFISMDSEREFDEEGSGENIDRRFADAIGQTLGIVPDNNYYLKSIAVDAAERGRREAKMVKDEKSSDSGLADLSPTRFGRRVQMEDRGATEIDLFGDFLGKKDGKPQKADSVMIDSDLSGAWALEHAKSDRKSRSKITGPEKSPLKLSMFPFENLIEDIYEKFKQQVSPYMDVVKILEKCRKHIDLYDQPISLAQQSSNPY